MDELSFYDGAYTGQEIDNAIGKVRNPDTTPTESSSELITSGGVKAALTALESDLAAIHATGTTNTTGAAIRSGTYFYLNGTLVQAKANIASGATFTSGTNYAAVTAGGLNDLKAALDNISSYDMSILATDVISSISSCTCKRVGKIVVVALSLQIGAVGNVYKELIGGLPPVNNPLYMLLSNGSVSTVLQVAGAAGGKIISTSEFAIQSGYYFGTCAYIAND